MAIPAREDEVASYTDIHCFTSAKTIDNQSLNLLYFGCCASEHNRGARNRQEVISTGSASTKTEISPIVAVLVIALVILLVAGVYYYLGQSQHAALAPDPSGTESTMPGPSKEPKLKAHTSLPSTTPASQPKPGTNPGK
jgi:hypothetical protein